MPKVVSFNINGVRARPHQLEAIRDQLAPDIIGLQETKVHDEQFPADVVQEIGYHVEFFGQKSHYGVALLSLNAPESVQKGWPWDDEDAQKRLIHAAYRIDGELWHVINGYFPQGESIHHETKFPAKRKFYSDLMRYLNENFTTDDNVLIMGDMNISPEDTDIGIGEPNRKRWLKSGKCSFQPEEREWYGTLLNWGLQDAHRKIHPSDSNTFSWFDYRSKGFDDTPKRGLRIDHILVTPSLYERCINAGVSYEIRGTEKPSDHAPIWATFK
ncbi:MAG: exodeoxyribonuclease III [Oceanospirillaceae bacterium]|jgi:exodeoxyribonuclease-3|uniref:exodeoxyribonuclease III n=1 Tax=Thalassolituus sp. UBA3500 TaxID=1947664 RepID=UPI000C103B06|nr:exodeoxyribonuclease III [Thalassolituus sp. UBA3500]MAG42713.1 exodeoxyribonuclease III [Oceanospirillaceae bacterium]MBN58517.1 exodeoxyribonuclease III [Oceanospirillaceae bacterium]MDQ4423849.1 exodeoxyribonuclease III [Thalassolituus sp.]|tara:strand:+ start:3021 stop:3833 length:813 start_codon:yes stop_codon:yes gene_type:complete